MWRLFTRKRDHSQPNPEEQIAQLRSARRLDALIAGMAADTPQREDYFAAVRELVEEYHHTAERPKHIAIPQFRWLRGAASSPVLLQIARDASLPHEMRRVALWALEKIDDRWIRDEVRDYFELEPDPVLRRVAATVVARPIGQRLEQVVADIEQRSPTEVPIAEDGITRLWSPRQCRLLQREYVQLLLEPARDEADATIILSLFNSHSEFGRTPAGEKLLEPAIESAFAELETAPMLRRLLDLCATGDHCERPLAARLLPLVCGGIDSNPEWDEMLATLSDEQRAAISKLSIDRLERTPELCHPLRGLSADVPARAVLRMGEFAHARRASVQLRSLLAEAPDDTPPETVSLIDRLVYLLEVCAEGESGVAELREAV